LTFTEETKNNKTKANNTGQNSKNTQKANLRLKKTEINNCKNCSCVCPYHCAQLSYTTQHKLEMWANAQRDGRPAEYRWRPLFNAAKFG